MRTVVDIDDPLLKDLKKIKKKRKSLGRLISDLLAKALGEDKLRKSEFNIAVNVKPGQCLLPEVLFLEFSSRIQYFKRKSSSCFWKPGLFPGQFPKAIFPLDYPGD
jgi:hypothetical protein